MLKLPLNLLLSIVCFGWQGNVQAQSPDSSSNKQKQFLIGVNTNVFGLQNGYSNAVGYAIQVGSKKVNLTFRFGFPSGYKDLADDVKSEYHTSGFYLQPGLTFYFGKEQHKDGKYSQYLRVMGYFATENHRLNIVFTDPYWGTSKEYNFSSSSTTQGFVMEWGVLFAVYKRLKIDCNIGLGVAGPRAIPFKELPSIENSMFFPGMGFGDGIYGAANVGVFFEL